MATLPNFRHCIAQMPNGSFVGKMLDHLSEVDQAGILYDINTFINTYFVVVFRLWT